jgi:hypothetical protein
LRRLAVFLALGAAFVLLAFAGGYYLSTGPGRELLRRETERVLTDILEGETRVEEVQLVFAGGLGLRGKGLSVYPTENGPAMRAERAFVEIHLTPLLVGELELAVLELDNLVIRADLRPDGTWTYPPLQSLQKPTVPADEEGAPILATLAGAEAAGRFILERERIAEKILIRGGEIHFEDHSLTAHIRPEMGVQSFHLRDIEASLSRPWLSEDGSLRLTGRFTGPLDGAPVPVELTGSVQDGEMRLALTTQNLDLDALDGYAQRLSQQADIDGTLSGSVILETADPGFQHVVAEAALSEVAPTVVVDGQPIHLSFPLGKLHARLEVEPTAVRLFDARLTGPRISLAMDGRAERPITRRSKAHFETELLNMAVGDVGPIVAQLPDATREALLQWFDRVETGTVDRIAVSGTSLLHTWGDFLQGELERMPENFLMTAEVSDITANLGGPERLTDGRVRMEWAGDQLAIRQGGGVWLGDELADVDITIDGISHFVEMQDPPHPSSAEPTPGLPLMWDILSRGGEAGEDDQPIRIRVDIDRLEHPVLRWPIENASLVVQPTPTGTESQVTRATWGGVPVVAEVLYSFHPRERITVGLTARRRDGEPAAHEKRDALVWGEGRFQLEPAADGGVPDLLSRMSGDFELRGSKVFLTPMEVTLSSTVAVAADIEVDLGDANHAEVRIQGRIEDTDFEALGEVIGLPEHFITGRVDVAADLAGTLDGRRPAYAELAGWISVIAEDGEIRQSIPMAVAMATATDGFNPFSKSEALQYDSIDADLEVKNGTLEATRLELEGPVRVYATGKMRFAEAPQEVDAVVGVFLVQRIRELLGKVPLVNLVLPGSDRGFVGAYFRLHGPWDDPEVDTMAMKSLTEAFPDLIGTPLAMIQSLWTSEEDDGDDSSGRSVVR